MNYEIVINKNNSIRDEELPQRLTVIGINNHPTISFENETNEILLEEKAALFFNMMMNDFNKKHSNKIIPDSGYRTKERQERLLKYYYDRDGEKAFTYAAPPGFSEHHTGLAIDIAMIVNGEFTDDITGDEPEILDLMANCYKYGFILRYPKGKEEITGYKYEPWHYRFVGLDLAKEIHESGLTLEEIKQLKL